MQKDWLKEEKVGGCVQYVFTTQALASLASADCKQVRDMLGVKHVLLVYY